MSASHEPNIRRVEKEFLIKYKRTKSTPSRKASLLSSQKKKQRRAWTPGRFCELAIRDKAFFLFSFSFFFFSFLFSFFALCLFFLSLSKSPQTLTTIGLSCAELSFLYCITACLFSAKYWMKPHTCEFTLPFVALN